MSEPLTNNLQQAVSGNYRLPFKAIFLESWRRVSGMKLRFWGGLALFLLTMLVTFIILTFIVSLYVVLLMPHNINVAPTSVNVQLTVSPVVRVLNFVVIGILEVLRLLLTTSLAYLALQHLRHHAISSNMVFAFRKAWQPLAIIGLALYLMNAILLLGSSSLLHHHLLTPRVFYSGLSVRFILYALWYAYVTTVVFMAILLILDQQLTLKNSLGVAFKSINKHLFKNMGLILLANIGFVVLMVITLGIGLIWLIPMMALLTAIQYNQIFCQGNLR